MSSKAAWNHPLVATMAIGACAFSPLGCEFVPLQLQGQRSDFIIGVGVEGGVGC
jgi:hypothetical protein